MAELGNAALLTELGTNIQLELWLPRLAVKMADKDAFYLNRTEGRNKPESDKYAYSLDVGLLVFNRFQVLKSLATQTQNVFGEELYPSAIDKAAAMIRSIIADYPVVDGNKRTTMLAGLTLLKINNVQFTAKPGETEDFAVKIATDKLDIPAIVSWLREHTEAGQSSPPRTGDYVDVGLLALYKCRFSKVRFKIH
ncbi:MAG TPA: type II toxin-antitoxin system death-on-curing family toxin [Candidatus Saccharimonadales bacterium]|nr:type II toxin-antitoxin system death-on-curing family toxin [Candidatus Saccharimonadales bacterium]